MGASGSLSKRSVDEGMDENCNVSDSTYHDQERSGRPTIRQKAQHQQFLLRRKRPLLRS
jgi:hypothetical protein